MTDDQITAAWESLEPSPLQRQRIDARVTEWLEARDTPLAVEWLGLFKATPIAAVGLLAVSTVSLLTAPPLIWVARALM